MIANGITAESLLACLSGIAPLELKGTALLRESRSPGACFPTGLPRQRVQEAVEEVVAYTERCTQTLRRLANLAPVPLLTACVEYGL